MGGAAQPGALADPLRLPMCSPHPSDSAAPRVFSSAKRYHNLKSTSSPRAPGRRLMSEEDRFRLRIFLNELESAARIPGLQPEAKNKTTPRSTPAAEGVRAGSVLACRCLDCPDRRWWAVSGDGKAN